jgi:hypothetical protein
MTAGCCQVDTLGVEEIRPPVVLKKALEKPLSQNEHRGGRYILHN